MRIGINALILKKQNTGTGYYTKLLVESFVPHTEHEFFVFVTNASLLQIVAPHIHLIQIPLAAKNIFFRIFAEQVLLKRYVKKYNLDILHSTSFVIPFNVKIPQVVTVHDMFHELYKHTIKPINRLYYAFFFNRSMRKATGIIAVSQNTKADIQKILSIDSKKITVIYQGVNPAFINFKATDKLKKEFDLLKLPERYLLYVGSLEPRKNIEKIIDAVALVKEKISYKLVIVGAKKWKTSQIFDKVIQNDLQNSVIFLGYIDAQMLPLIYKHAILFLFPTLYEGFGLPVIEAMNMGIPVITSSNSSLQEIGSHSTICVNPIDENAIANAIIELCSSLNVRNDLIAKSFEQVKKYRWENTAFEILRYYDNILKP